jgi:hypothetical protein
MWNEEKVPTHQPWAFSVHWIFRCEADRSSNRFGLPDVPERPLVLFSHPSRMGMEDMYTLSQCCIRYYRMLSAKLVNEILF